MATAFEEVNDSRLVHLQLLETHLHHPQKFHSEDALVNNDTEPQLIGEDLLSHLTAKYVYVEHSCVECLLVHGHV